MMVYDLSRTVVKYTSSYGWTSEFSVFTYYKQVYDGLMPLIGNAIGTCALLGNLQNESYIVPFCKQGDTPPTQASITYTTQINNGSIGKNTFVNTESGYGLAQWTAADRKAGYFDYWKSSGIESIGDTQVGINYLKFELQNKYKSTLSVLQNATDIKTASDYVLIHFESPKDQTEPVKLNRATMGEYYYKVLSGSPPTPTNEVQINPTYLEMQINTSHVLTATTTLSAPNITWSSTGVDIISTDGLRCTISAKSVGQGTVTVTVSDSSGSYSSTCNINVISGTPSPTGSIEVSPLYVPIAFIGDTLDFIITKSGNGTVTCIPYGGIQILSASETACIVKCVGIGQAHLNVALHIGEQFIASSTATINIAPRSGKNKTILYGRNPYFKLFS